MMLMRIVFFAGLFLSMGCQCEMNVSSKPAKKQAVPFSREASAEITHEPRGHEGIKRNVIQFQLNDELASVVYKIASKPDAHGIVVVTLHGLRVKDGCRVKTTLRGLHTIDDHKIVNAVNTDGERRISYNWNRELKRLWTAGAISDSTVYEVHVAVYEGDKEIEIPKLTDAELSVILAADWEDRRE